MSGRMAISAFCLIFAIFVSGFIGMTAMGRHYYSTGVLVIVGCIVVIVALMRLELYGK